MTTGAENKKKNIIDVIPALVVTQRSTQVHQGHEQNESWKFVEFKAALHGPIGYVDLRLYINVDAACPR